jgi:hypothetical protein
VAALEDLSADDRALAALVERVPEKVATDFEVALEGHDMIDQFGFLVGRERDGHGDNSTGKKGPLSSENGPDWLRR